MEDMLRRAEMEFDGEMGGGDVYVADERLRQPLVRLRVEHSGGYEIVPPQRFGQAFVGRIANSADILSFHKRRAASTSASGTATSTLGGAAGSARRLFAKGVLAENPGNRSAGKENEEDEVKVPDLVRHYLNQQQKLGILPINGLNRYAKPALSHCPTCFPSHLPILRPFDAQLSVYRSQPILGERPALLSTVIDSFCSPFSLLS